MTSLIGSKLLRTAQVVRPVELLANNFHTSTACLAGGKGGFRRQSSRTRLAEPLEIRKPGDVPAEDKSKRSAPPQKHQGFPIRRQPPRTRSSKASADKSGNDETEDGERSSDTKTQKGRKPSARGQSSRIPPAEPLEFSRPIEATEDKSSSSGRKRKSKEPEFVREDVPHTGAPDRFAAPEPTSAPRRRKRETEARGTWGTVDRHSSYVPKSHNRQEDAPPVAAEPAYEPRPAAFDTLVPDDFERSVHSEPVRGLPAEFTSPPLMPGLVDSVLDVLGPHAAPTPIQGLALKHVLYPWKTREEAAAMPWREFLLASETGSGKSLAYMLPMLQDLKASELASAEPSGRESRRAYSPRAIVLAPTHELSRQLSATAKSLLHNIKMRVLCASQANVPSASKQNVSASRMSAMFENVDMEAAGGLYRHKARPIDVLVGTPNKVMEMVRGHGWDWDARKENEAHAREAQEKGIQNTRKPFVVGEPEVDLHRVEWVVIDEADVLFDHDFQKRTRLLLSDIAQARGQPVSEAEPSSEPPAAPVHAQYPFNLILTSATIPTSLANYLDKHHPRLKRLVSPRLHHLPSTLRTEHAAWTSGNRHADVESRIKRIWWADVHQQPNGRRSRILVFCNRSAKVEELGRYLAQNGVPNVALTSTADARRPGSNHHLDGFLRTPAAHDAADAQKTAADKEDDDKMPHVLITTSLLSRGLDFSPDIKNVFIVDTPRNMIDFLHRAGRTARAGGRGTVVVFGKAEGRGSMRDVQAKGEIKKLRLRASKLR